MFRVFKEYMKRNSEKHAELTKGDKIAKEWLRAENEFPEDIKSLIKNAVKSGGVDIYVNNDDITPMEYVVFVLEVCFGFSLELATQKALQVHMNEDYLIISNIESKSAEYLVAYLRGHANSRGFPLCWEVKNT